MTSYADPAVYQCPECNGHLLRARMRSFNTYGVRYWSDGDSTFSRLPSRSPLVRCPHCVAVFWEQDSSALGALPRKPMEMGWVLRWLEGDENGEATARRKWATVPEPWKASLPDDVLNSSDLHRALQSPSPLTEARELFVRRWIWWFSGDHRRERISGGFVETAPVIPESAAQANAVRLLELLEQAGDVVAHAELLRQMGRFDEAVSVLAVAELEGWFKARAEEIRDWARNGDDRLKLLEVNRDSW